MSTKVIPVALGLLSVVIMSPLSARAGILPPESIVGGRTVGEWTAECWKWIYSISTNENPLLDCDGSGRFAHNRQPGGDVFFIAPVNGLLLPPCVRTFTVPERKFILMPVLAVTFDNIDVGPPPFTVPEMCDALESVLREPVDLHASIDGIPVPDLLRYRAKSPAFSFYFPTADNTLSISYEHSVVGLLDPICRRWTMTMKAMISNLKLGSLPERF